MSVKYDHLVGLQFNFGVQDCYTLLQQFYKDNYDLTFPNYARPSEFWKFDFDLYRERYLRHGFYPLDCHPSEYQVGDVFLMAVQSKIGNHVGILVDEGKMLHHLWGKLSSADPYRDIWRNTTVGVFRNTAVTVEKSYSTTNIQDYLSPTMKRKLRVLRTTTGVV